MKSRPCAPYIVRHIVRRWPRPLGKLALVLALVPGGPVSLSLAQPPPNVVAMPDRDALMGTQMVVWGNTRHPNGSAYTLDFGDLTPAQVGVVADQSYIAHQHTYATAGVFTATLTVSGDS